MTYQTNALPIDGTTTTAAKTKKTLLKKRPIAQRISVGTNLKLLKKKWNPFKHISGNRLVSQPNLDPNRKSIF